LKIKVDMNKNAKKVKSKIKQKIAWDIRMKIIRTVLCYIVYLNVVQCNVSIVNSV